MFRGVQVACRGAKASNHAGFGMVFVLLFSVPSKMMRLPQSPFDLGTQKKRVYTCGAKKISVGICIFTEHLNNTV